MTLSFIIAGVFWISHHRRLTLQPMGSRGIVMLNLLFLLSIILLPVTNSLYGNYGMSGAVAVLYGLHLTAIAGLNALLWRLALGPGYHPELIAASFPLLLFIPGHDRCRAMNRAMRCISGCSLSSGWWCAGSQVRATKRDRKTHASAIPHPECSA